MYKTMLVLAPLVLVAALLVWKRQSLSLLGLRGLRLWWHKDDLQSLLSRIEKKVRRVEYRVGNRGWVPGRIGVWVSVDDYNRLETVGLDRIEASLVEIVNENCEKNNLEVVGRRVEVVLHPDSLMTTGGLRVSAEPISSDYFDDSVPLLSYGDVLTTDHMGVQETVLDPGVEVSRPVMTGVPKLTHALTQSHAKLVLCRYPERAVMLDRTEVVIGRSDISGLDWSGFRVEWVSADHCKIFQRNGSFLLMNLSRNGTTVDDVAVGAEPVVLADGCMIKLSGKREFPGEAPVFKFQD